MAPLRTERWSVPDQMTQANHTARIFLWECRADRHGHRFWFAFNAAQLARQRATPQQLPPALRPLPAQLDLLV